jgi:hypothetical protein
MTERTRAHLRLSLSSAAFLDLCHRIQRTNYADPSMAANSNLDEDGLPKGSSATVLPPKHRQTSKKPTPNVRTLLTPQYRKTLAQLLDENVSNPVFLHVSYRA